MKIYLFIIIIILVFILKEIYYQTHVSILHAHNHTIFHHITPIDECLWESEDMSFINIVVTPAPGVLVTLPLLHTVRVRLN